MNDELQERKKGILAIVFLTFCYGLLALLPRFLSLTFSLFQQVYLRMLFGLVFSMFFWRNKINIFRNDNVVGKEIGLVALRSILYYLVGVVLYTKALLLTKISNVTFIGAMPMTAFLGFVLLKEKINLKKILLVLLSFLGVLVVSASNFSTFFFGKGEAIALLSIVFISLACILRKYHSDNLNDKELTVLLLFFAFVFTFITSVITGENLPTSGWSLKVVLFLTAGGILNILVNFLINYGFARVDAVLANNLIALDPVFATILSYFAFQEVPVVREVFGGVLIIFSAVFMHKLETNNDK